jgi:cobalt/nickel transport system permease protein
MHRGDPRVKVLNLLVFLVTLATAHRDLLPIAGALGGLLCCAIVWSRLPLTGALGRAAVVLPFSLAFAGVCWIAGDPTRGIHLAVKSYLSALAVLLVVSTTPLPALLGGLEAMGAPRFLLMVAQFLYRYLFVISEEAQHMAKAAQSRGATAAGMMGRSARFRAAAGALAVLFARSYGRAAEIHRAMLARGFQGHIETLAALHFRRADLALVIAGSLGPVALRLAVERFS